MQIPNNTPSAHARNGGQHPLSTLAEGLRPQGCNALEWLSCGAAVAGCAALSGPALVACVAAVAPGCVKCVT